MTFKLALFYNFALLLLVGFSSIGLAHTDRFSIVPEFASQQKTDFILTPGSPTLGKGQFNFSQFLDYGYRPLSLTLGGNRVNGIVDHLLVQQLNSQIGLNDRWTIGINLPVIWWNHFTHPTTSVQNNKTRLGDVSVEARYSFLNRDQDSFGLMMSAAVSVPTMSNDIFVGETTPTANLKIVADKNLGKKISIGLTAGVKIRQKTVFLDYESASLFSTGLTAKAHLGKGFSGKVEIATASDFNHFYTNKANSPTEALASLNKSFEKQNIDVSVGSGMALIRSAGTPLFHTFLGLSYTGKNSKNKKQKNKEWKIIFAKNSTRLTPQIRSILDQVAAFYLQLKKPEAIILEGHVLNERSSRSALHRNRISNVKRYLVQRGLRETLFQPTFRLVPKTIENINTGPMSIRFERLSRKK